MVLRILNHSYSSRFSSIYFKLIFLYICDQTSTFVLVHVNDIIIIENNNDVISNIKIFLAQSWQSIALNKKFFMSTNTLDILFGSGMVNSGPSNFSTKQYLHLQPRDGTPLPDSIIYHKYMSRLFISDYKMTWHSICCKYSQSICEIFMILLRYLKGSVGKVY